MPVCLWNNRDMPRLACAVFLLTVLIRAQSFDSKMPESVPEVSGMAVENLSMHYIDVKLGDGALAAPGKNYTVHYTGWLRNGTKFDSSVDRKEPFKFVQGRRQVIAGWEVGFEGMKTGGKRRLFIPYQLAYGEQGRGSIPPKSELVFDVELLSVDEPPKTPAAVDVLLPFNELEKKVNALAAAVPVEKFAWRPAAGVRSFGEVFLHIAVGNEFLLKVANTLPARDEIVKLVEETAKKEKQEITKERVIEMLKASFAAVRKSMESATAGALGRDADFFGQPTTRRGIFTLIDTHISEHLGQAIAYARMNGIVPPWSAGQ
jgi:peptidylprolyl isomerase